jgi:hypothetical protein
MPEQTLDKNDQKHAYELTISKKEVKIVADWFDGGVRIIIMSLHSHFTVYFGIPENHPLAGFSYNDLPISVHGGLTFAHKGDDKYLPVGFFWYGWDYAHVGDFTYFEGIEQTPFKNDRDWTLKEVKDDIFTYNFKLLMQLAERIAKCPNKQG